MFGMSFGEIAVLLVIAVIVVGPRKLPTLMRTTGQWLAKLRRMSSDLRSQSGIDDLVRPEGLEKEIHELRALSRVNFVDTLVAPVMTPTQPKPLPTVATPSMARPKPATSATPLREREYPLIGCDSYEALPDDAAPYVEATSADPAAAKGSAASERLEAVGAAPMGSDGSTSGTISEGGTGFSALEPPTRPTLDLTKLSFPLVDSTLPLASTLVSPTILHEGSAAPPSIPAGEGTKQELEKKESDHPSEEPAPPLEKTESMLTASKRVPSSEKAARALTAAKRAMALNKSAPEALPSEAGAAPLDKSAPEALSSEADGAPLDKATAAPEAGALRPEPPPTRAGSEVSS